MGRRYSDQQRKWCGIVDVDLAIEECVRRHLFFEK